MLDVPTILSGLKRTFRRRTRPGAVPGTIRVDPQAPPPKITVIAYGPDELHEQEIDDPARIAEFLRENRVAWINVDGLGDAAVIEKIGEMFGLHPLALEDVVNVHQRAKVEDYEDHLFIVARMVMLVAGDETDDSAKLPDIFPGELQSEQIGMFLGENFVLTFQERPGDCLDPVRRRLRRGRGRIRELGPDYLAYSILDAVVDGYFPVVEQYGGLLDALDEEVAEHAARETIRRIHRVRSDLLFLRRHIWPHREATNALLRDDHRQISAETRVFLRDCYDHTVQILDVVETYREMCSDLRDYYYSSLGHRTNDIMRVLTVIATIFIPLTFIAGVYGMNFETMPELKWDFGYAFALSLMAAVAGGLVYYFWRKGWIKE